MSRARAYYSLITAEILFQLPENPETFTTRLNGVLSDSLPEITAKLIGKAQQIVQLHFHKRMEGETPKVIDVVILNLAPLGHMTEAEFQSTPANDTKAQRMTNGQPFNQDDPFTSI